MINSSFDFGSLVKFYGRGGSVLASNTSTAILQSIRCVGPTQLINQ